MRMLEEQKQKPGATHFRVMQARTGVQHEPGITYRVDVLLMPLTRPS
jgi:hypothetical protein